jgi:hypothetical protein
MTDTCFLSARNQLQLIGTETHCPHCGAQAAQLPIAFPPYSQLRPGQTTMVGVVLECAACRTPLFRRYRIAEWRADGVALHPGFEELERPTEAFALNYLPAVVANCFREALRCYSAGFFQAFGVMCRLTIQAMVEDLGERSRMQLFEQVADIRNLARIDDETFVVIRRVLFDNDLLRLAQLTGLSTAPAATLLEVMKDVLYQSYVRKAKLTAGLRSRGVPAGDSTAPVAPAVRQGRQ